MPTDHSYYQQPQDYKDILYEVDAPLARITLNRPEKMNALRNQLRGELFHALRVAETDPDVSVIIIKGAGRCFSAGYDLGGGIGSEDLPDVGPIVPGPAQWPRHLNAGYFLIWDLTKVVIAQAHGYCLAGGSELASYCDLFVVADDALIGYPPVRDMSPPDNCWFPWHLPMRKAKEMIFTGDPLTGKQAVEYGLANYSVPADELDEFTTKLAERVALVSPKLLALSKRQINRAYEVMGIRTALSAGNDIMALLGPGGGSFVQTLREQGLHAAIEERSARWGGYGPSPLLRDDD
jgi:enoyl-CoA hydratase/carnithine racemase